jgi:hypothetical protein
MLSSSSSWEGDKMAYSPYTSILSAVRTPDSGSPMNAGTPVVFSTLSPFTEATTPISVDCIDATKTKFGFNKNDRPVLKRYGLFANFADGLLFKLYSVEARMNIADTNLSDVSKCQLLNMNALNTWYDVEDEVEVQLSDPLQTKMWANVQWLGQFATDIVDTTLNGQEVRFEMCLQFEHTFRIIGY